jgi:hypothetical protein
MKYGILEIDPVLQEMEDRMHALYYQRQAKLQESAALGDRAWERYHRKRKFWMPKLYDRLSSLTPEESVLFDELLDEVQAIDRQIASLMLRLRK